MVDDAAPAPARAAIIAPPAPPPAERCTAADASRLASAARFSGDATVLPSPRAAIVAAACAAPANFLASCLV